MQRVPCLEWAGSRWADGYGRLGNARAHRAVWEATYGPIPRGVVVMHSCDNKPCVRLAHLSLGTAADNSRDRDAKGRGYGGERHHSAQLSRADVRRIRSRYGSGGISQQALADEYGVSQVAIGKIVRRVTWKRF